MLEGRYLAFKRVVRALALSLLVGLLLLGPYLDHRRVKKRVVWLEKEIAKVKEENLRLEKERDELSNDLYRLEMEARRLGMAKEGEWVVHFSKDINR